jgi:hypothetical protein
MHCYEMIVSSVSTIAPNNPRPRADEEDIEIVDGPLWSCKIISVKLPRSTSTGSTSTPCWMRLGRSSVEIAESNYPLGALLTVITGVVECTVFHVHKAARTQSRGLRPGKISLGIIRAASFVPPAAATDAINQNVIEDTLYGSVDAER